MAFARRRRGRAEDPSAARQADARRGISDWTLPAIPTDWLPPEVMTQPRSSEATTSASPQDWVPPGLPDQAPEPPRRRRSSATHEVPAMPAPEAPAAPARAASGPSRSAPAAATAAPPAPAAPGSPAPPAPAPPAAPAPAASEPPAPAAPAARPGAAAGRVPPLRPPGSLRPGDTVNINTADVEQLVLLPGIGWRAAERIVAFREQRGPFRSLAELTKVEGIHADRLKRLAPHATL